MAAEKKDVTMRDVARAAGVSLTTVSHVLRGTAPITGGRAAAVRAAAERLGYELPPPSEPRGSRRTVGVLLPRQPDGVVSRIFLAASDAARRAGYAVLLCGGADEAAALAGRGGFCGLLCMDRVDGEALRRLARRLPVAAVGWSAEGLDAVRADTDGSLRELVRRLAAMDRTRLGFLGPDEDCVCGGSLAAGFRRALEASSLRFYPEWVHATWLLRQNRAAGGYALVREQLAERLPPPQAWLCADDEIAAGVLAALREFDRAPPRVAVAGCGASPLGAYLSPPLTTVLVDADALGREAFGLLQRRLRRPGAPPEQLVLRAPLLFRDSLRAPSGP